MANCGSTSANGDAVEREVPGGEPGVLPLVRHRHDAHRVQVPPVLVADRAGATPAAGSPGCRRRASAARRTGRSAWSTAGRRAPGAARSRSSVGRLRRMDRCVELVGLAPALVDDRRRPRRAGRPGRSCRTAAGAAPTEPPGGTRRSDSGGPPWCRACSGLTARLAVDDVAMERVLDVRRAADAAAGRRRARSSSRCR